MVCHHRANSFIIQYKSSISIGCFETDIFFQKDKAISTHGMHLSTNLQLEDFLNSKYNKNTIWMDSKNLHKTKNCYYGLKWFQKNSSKFESLLVELQTVSIQKINDQNWINCIREISKIENI